jgi:hypothetical protein
VVSAREAISYVVRDSLPGIYWGGCLI